MPSDADLRAAYDALDYELIQQTESLTIPTATPARFDYADAPGVCDATELERRLDDSALTCLDVLAENGDAWYEFHLSADVYADDERCSLTASTGGVTIVRREELSFDAFERVVEIVADALDAELTYGAPEGDN